MNTDTLDINNAKDEETIKRCPCCREERTFSNSTQTVCDACEFDPKN